MDRKEWMLTSPLPGMMHIFTRVRHTAVARWHLHHELLRFKGHNMPLWSDSV